MNKSSAKQTKTLSLLQIIQENIPKLAGNNRTVALTFLENPQAVITEKINDFAGRCKCDPAQVVRFCKRFGCNGFTNFKARLTSELLDPERTLHEQMETSNAEFSGMTQRLADTFRKAIEDTRHQLSEKDILTAVQMIENSEIILVCGFGSSGLIAQDFQSKMFRLGHKAIIALDFEYAKNYCATLLQGDLLIAISSQGETQSILELASIAAQNKTPVLAMTNYLQSPLAQMSNLVLPTISNEQPLRIGAMSSTIAQLFVVDTICMLLLKRHAVFAEERIQNIFRKTKKQ